MEGGGKQKDHSDKNWDLQVGAESWAGAELAWLAEQAGWQEGWEVLCWRLPCCNQMLTPAQLLLWLCLSNRLPAARLTVAN